LLLLGLPIAVVALLYLILFPAFLLLSAFLALRATRTPSARSLSVTLPLPEIEPYKEPAPSPARVRSWIPVRVAMVSAAAALVIVLGGGALLAIGDTLRLHGDGNTLPSHSDGDTLPSGSDGDTLPSGSDGDASPSGRDVPADAADASEAPLGPAIVTPMPGQVTVGLAATTDAQLRVTVDGTVEFEGTLAAGEWQTWNGSQRIQVWTDSGRTLQLAVNGYSLGDYSTAMGHSDWNRIEFGFWPGWTQ
jgi:hypothetical protein